MTTPSNLFAVDTAFKMRTTRYAVTALLMFLAACSDYHSPQQVNSDQSNQSPTQVAVHELENVRGSTQWTLLGLGPMEDAGKAALGKPLRVYFAKSDELGNYAGGDLDRILHKTDDLVFPVLVHGEGRLLIQVGNRGGKWTVIRDGYQDSAPAFVTSEKTWSGAPIPTVSIFIKLSSLNESNLLLTSKAKVTGPGGGNEPIATPDLNAVIQVMQLNGEPLI